MGVWRIQPQPVEALVVSLDNKQVYLFIFQPAVSFLAKLKVIVIDTLTVLY